MEKTKRLQTERLVLMALFTALVAVLSYFGGFIKLGGLASISLTLIPVVLGSALIGPLAGAWLGGVAGVVQIGGFAGIGIAHLAYIQCERIRRRRCFADYVKNRIGILHKFGNIFIGRSCKRILWKDDKWLRTRI